MSISYLTDLVARRAVTRVVGRSKTVRVERKDHIATPIGTATMPSLHDFTAYIETDDCSVCLKLPCFSFNKTMSCLVTVLTIWMTNDEKESFPHTGILCMVMVDFLDE